MALDYVTRAKAGWIAEPSERFDDRLWGDFVVLLGRAGNDVRQLHRRHVLEFWQSAETADDELRLIEAELECYWSGGREGDERSLVVPSNTPQGFDVALFVDARGIRGSFGGLAQEFDSIATAMHWVRRALSSSYRLRTLSVDGSPKEWRLEPAHGRRKLAAEVLEGGHVSLMSWFRRKTVEYRQNSLGLTVS